MPSLLDRPASTDAPVTLEESAHGPLLQRPFDHARIAAEFREERSASSRFWDAFSTAWAAFFSGMRKLGDAYADSARAEHPERDRLDRYITLGMFGGELYPRQPARCCNDEPLAR